MDRAKRRASALVQDADEIDDDVDIGKELPQHPNILNVRDDDFRGGQDSEVHAVGEAPRGHANGVTVAHQPRYQLRSDEARATEHADMERTYRQERAFQFECCAY